MKKMNYIFTSIFCSYVPGGGLSLSPNFVVRLFCKTPTRSVFQFSFPSHSRFNVSSTEIPLADIIRMIKFRVNESTTPISHKLNLP